MSEPTINLRCERCGKVVSCPRTMLALLACSECSDGWLAWCRENNIQVTLIDARSRRSKRGA